MVLGCSGNCKLSFNTDVISGNYSYDEKLSGSVGIGGGSSVAGNKVNGSFGASIGWNHVNQMTEGGKNVFTMSEVIILLVLRVYVPPQNLSYMCTT